MGLRCPYQQIPRIEMTNRFMAHMANILHWKHVSQPFTIEKITV